MRAPIEPGKPGWDPDDTAHRGAKVGAALRGAGFVIIVLAFLVVSQTFVSSDDDPAATTSPGRATVYAPTELTAIIVGLDSTATVNYGASTELRQQVSSGAPADVFVGLTADAQTLVGAGDCGEPTPITTGPTGYAACLVIRDGARVAAGTQFIKDLNGIGARAALLDAGYDLPPR